MSAIQFGSGLVPAQAQTSADNSRKKRKRAPAQGAADDCFTCLNRSIKCDRRRPYCSQCLDGGQDCTGYKTQLTWGMGVASRGKLRGLSLPVAGTTKTASDSTASPKPRKKAANSNKKETITSVNTTSVAALSSDSPVSNRGGRVPLKVSAPHQQPPHVRQQEDVRLFPPLATREGSGRYLSLDIHTDLSPTSVGVYGYPLDLPPAVSAFTHSSIASSPYNAAGNIKAQAQSTPSPTSQYFQPISHQANVSLLPSSHQPNVSLLPTSHPPYSVSPDVTDFSRNEHRRTSHLSFPDQTDYTNQTLGYPLQSSKSNQTISDTVSPIAEDEVEEINRELIGDGTYSDTLSTSSFSFPNETTFNFPLSGTCTIGKTPRMQYLIQYYAEVIAPVLVAFDSPSNPLRNQILGLAARSESLQHAISALSASNLRQRRESGTVSTGKTPGARRSSYMHLNLTNDTWDDSQHLTDQERKREETGHKYAAVRSLNKQLAHLLLRKDDSVLATLLILCLFHMCDSGIARFQTQFEGVKKLLKIRGNSLDGKNGDSVWMTRFFTWFDNLAATVNDRESQLDSQYVDISAQFDGDWSHATLTGVDGELFKTLSRLGRLNVLSQGRPVESEPTVVSRPAPSMPTSNQTPGEFSTFDGNGWMRIMSDEDFFTLKTASPSVRERFWREWREVRHDLQTWKFDSSHYDGSNATHPFLTPEQRFDMDNVSESFRYAALLYTERLANPRLPSLDAKIQGWVQKALYHIKQVRADVYLLWPLFITGSECGDEHERNIIRERCLDIQNDSGFMNNSSCLALLEKVWQKDRETSASREENDGALVRTTFKFREVMLAEGNEGEWIVV